MSEHNHHDEHHEDEHHDHPITPHIFTLAALMGLTVITWATASYLKAGEPWDTLIALAIALTKASLVIMIFMHVREASRLVKLVAFSGFFWVFLFFAYLVADVQTRQDATVYEGWQPDVRKVYAAEGAAHHGEGHGDESHGGDHGTAEDHGSEGHGDGH